MTNKKILVVGTTSDYIEILAARAPGRLIFITDIQERAGALFPLSVRADELVLDLEDERAVLRTVLRYLDENKVTLSGIVCFDCESLPLASAVAVGVDVPFPSYSSAMACRNKFVLKQIWQKHDVPSARARLIRSTQDIKDYFRSTNMPAVMKPLFGSGSELVFLCENEDIAAVTYGLISQRLKKHKNRRMYGSIHHRKQHFGRESILLEQFIPGEEYSCDFILDQGEVRVIRMVKKFSHQKASFGTTAAYILPAEYPAGWDPMRLGNVLKHAAGSLGLTRALAMVDFKIHNGEISLLELTPRIGGDCLPPLISASCGLDMLQAALDFAEGKTIQVPDI
ncbi:MAG: ATP-grasp domain-containing protein, partial [Candidatus Omnitrophica bacterium]|nr:ATP-grasp domain-containing protein [Candidatus Omnitrophota bacterium]